MQPGTFTKLRNRLILEKVAKHIFIQCNLRLLRDLGKKEHFHVLDSLVAMLREELLGTGPRSKDCAHGSRSMKILQCTNLQ